MGQMTAIQTIQHVTAFLLNQYRKAVDDCTYKYHARDGKKCAIGCLIPSSLYQDSFEGMFLEDILNENNAVAEHILPSDLNRSKGSAVLHRLQCIHDRFPVHEWKKELEALAKEYQ